jgi:hypothetical protein
MGIGIAGRARRLRKLKSRAARRKFDLDKADNSKQNDARCSHLAHKPDVRAQIDVSVEP